MQNAIRTMEASGLVEVKLLDAADDGQEQADGRPNKRPRGHPVITFRKRAWTDVAASDAAARMLACLRVGADAFHA